jgi:hypothetical protein
VSGNIFPKHRKQNNKEQGREKIIQEKIAKIPISAYIEQR